VLGAGRRSAGGGQVKDDGPPGWSEPLASPRGLEPGRPRTQAWRLASAKAKV